MLCAANLIVTTMMRAGRHVRCRWDRRKHFRGGSTSALWIVILRVDETGRWLRRAEYL